MARLKEELIQTEKDPCGIRINKFLGDAGVCSRREADRLILEGRVSVDGKKAEIGQRILPGQRVFVDGEEKKQEEALILLAFHKPVGIECTTDPENPDNIVDFIDYPSRIFPVGRLDKNSSGLIFLTNTGEISDKILRSRNYHEKEYVVKVNKPVTSSFLRRLGAGVPIELKDGAVKTVTRPCLVYPEGEDTFRIILTQGLNRQIRRMCKALGYEVISLKRIRIMNVLLGDLPEGTYRELTEEETKTLLAKLR